MTELKNKKELAKNLLAYDLPPADKELKHKEVLFKKVKRHILLGKVIGGAIYIMVFSIALPDFLLAFAADAAPMDFQLRLLWSWFPHHLL